MKIDFSPYELIRKSKANAKVEDVTQKGSLIRLTDANQNWGVADICPWPALGDLDLASEIKNKGSLYLRAIELALEDLQARKENKSLLRDQWVKNNILVNDYHNFNFNNSLLKNCVLKIKGDQRIEELLRVLNALPVVKSLRIDFNAVLSVEEFQFFLKSYQGLNKIEYIEDPTDFNETMWFQWNQIIPLAADFVKAQSGYTYKMIKPSRESVVTSKKITITSAMDHPVGVAHALRMAQKQAQNESGLLTLDLYETTAFHSYFIYQNQDEINFSPQALNDTGIGMTAELCKLSWRDDL